MHQECYICGLHMPCYIFWTPSQAGLTSGNIEAKQSNYYIKESEKYFNDAETDPNKVYIQGDFTNWEPQEVTDLANMCRRATRSRIPDFEKLCVSQDKFKYKRDGSIPAEGYEMMREEEE